MRTVEAKLADWHRLYKELAQAQVRLAQGDAVQAEVARLQRDCDAALDVVNSLLYGRNAAGAKEGSRPRA